MSRWRRLAPQERGALPPCSTRPPPPTSLHEAFRDLDIITPNQTEAEYHTGIRVDDIPSAKAAAEALLERGVATAIVKMAEQGVYWASQEGSGHVPAYDVDVVDTISAGDAFSGGLAVALAEGRSMHGGHPLRLRGRRARRHQAGRPNRHALTRRSRRPVPTRPECAVNPSWHKRSSSVIPGQAGIQSPANSVSALVYPVRRVRL